MKVDSPKYRVFLDSLNFVLKWNQCTLIKTINESNSDFAGV